MLLQINGLQISNLQKANDKTVSVDIIANHLTEDTENETILKDAFNKDAVDEFLNIGVVEFWHESRNPLLTKKEKNENLIGKPTAFRWENGLPVVTANLTKSHPIVEKMLPHLEANQPVYAASVGGSKMVLEVEDQNGAKKRVIPRIKWDHLAIAPANNVINRMPGMNVKLLKKANDVMCEFDNMDSFKENGSIVEKEEELKKALEAPGSVSDVYEEPGGVITKQSIEKKPVSLTLNEDESFMLMDAIIGVKNKTIPANKGGYLDYHNKKGKKDFGNKSFQLISKYFKNKKEQ